MLYYSAIRSNEIMASSGTEKKVEMIIATEVRETVSKKYDITSRWKLTMDTYELLEQRYTVHRLRKKNLLFTEKECIGPIEISYLK